MKFLLLRKFIWVILFSLVHLWFMVFNWQLFITTLNVDLGFGVVRLPPFVALFLTGFVILVIQSWTGYVNKLHRIIHDLEEELAQKNKEKKKDRTQTSRSSGSGVGSVTTVNKGSNMDGIPGKEQVAGSERNHQNLAGREERKDEGKRSGTDPKNPTL